jgi:hypothetical protein
VVLSWSLMTAATIATMYPRILACSQALESHHRATCEVGNLHIGRHKACSARHGGADVALKLVATCDIGHEGVVVHAGKMGAEGVGSGPAGGLEGGVGIGGSCEGSKQVPGFGRWGKGQGVMPGKPPRCSKTGKAASTSSQTRRSARGGEGLHQANLRAGARHGAGCKAVGGVD